MGTLCLIIVLFAVSPIVMPSVKVITTANAASRIKISKTKVTLYAGDSVKLKVIGTSKKVTWKTSNKKIATVSSKGAVVAKKKGTATVTAVVNSKKLKCSVKVNALKTINYADAESFEAALNAGKNLKGKIVRFVASELHPDSAFGYNIWAGEHLNFVSTLNPDVKTGDTVIVKITNVQSLLGSWIINYEKETHAKITNSTISNSVVAPKLDLKLVDSGWYLKHSYDENAYVEFCGVINNPNKSLIAEFPKVIVTVKNSAGAILTTEKQVGSIIMPGDTITLCGMFSLQSSDMTSDVQFDFDIDWSDLVTKSSIYSSAKTTDFTITNVTNRSSAEEIMFTGEITNGYFEDIDDVNLSVVLKKMERLCICRMRLLMD